MTSPAQPERADSAAVATGALLAAMAAFATWDQWAVWSTKEDYTFGYLVPFLAAYVVWDRWDLLLEALRGSPSGDAAAPWQTSFAYLLAFGSLLVFALGAAGRAIFGTGPVPTLAIAFGLAGAGLTFSYLSPRSADGRTSSSSRLRAAGLLTFPTCVWIVSGPFLYLVDNRVKGELLTLVTEVVSGILRASGHVIRTSGNTIIFANNDAVGVADACSGIRSLSACVFAAAFLGAVFIEGGTWGALLRKMALMAAGGCVAVLLNLGRNVFLAKHALEHGSRSLELDPWGVAHGAPGFSFLGTVHDLAGNVAMVLALFLLVALVPLLNRTGRPNPER